MNKRVIAAVAAGVLALLGVLVLVVYAQGANDRAFDGAKLVSVVRLTKDVKAGTSSADLAASTETVKLPDASVPSGAVTDLDQVAGLSTNASVQQGEVLLKSRMDKPGTATKAASQVPAGLQEVTIALDAERSVGGSITAGDTVGVIATFEPKDQTKGQFTSFALDKVLVTRVDRGLSAVDSGGGTAASLITVAVGTLDAERLVHAQKWGTVWLTLQNADTDTSGGKPITAADVVR